MKLVLQRCSSAQVVISGKVVGAIPENSEGFMLLAGIEDADSQEDIDWLVRKVCNMRILEDEQGMMGRSIRDVGGDILLVSQFTLHASTKKGNRPSFCRAAKPDIAKPLFNALRNTFERVLGKPIQTGVFGADMQVSIVNDGPVTILLDSKNRD